MIDARIKKITQPRTGGVFNRPIIVNKIKRSKLEWAGHARRKQNSMMERLPQENPKNTRPQSRLRVP